MPPSVLSAYAMASHLYDNAATEPEVRIYITTVLLDGNCAV